MFPTLRRFLVLLVGLAVIGAAVTSVLPATLDVERRIVIAAEPGVIHEQLANLPSWPEWTSWNRSEDPRATMTFEGEGVGQRWTWRGQDFGSGALEVTKSDPTEGLEYELDAGSIHGTGRVHYEVKDGETEVVWHGRSELPYVLRWLGLKMDKALGDDLARNLEALKERVEGHGASPPK